MSPRFAKISRRRPHVWHATEYINFMITSTDFNRREPMQKHIVQRRLKWVVMNLLGKCTAQFQILTVCVYMSRFSVYISKLIVLILTYSLKGQVFLIDAVEFSNSN